MFWPGKAVVEAGEAGVGFITRTTPDRKLGSLPKSTHDYNGTTTAGKNNITLISACAPTMGYPLGQEEFSTRTTTVQCSYPDVI